jgi:4'-phosphopantetheinyl transferase
MNQHRLLTIPTNQIDLWSADLDDSGYSEERAFALLSSDERERVRLYRFPLHRTRYTRRRAILRILLGRYLSAAPESIAFSYGPDGKPEIAGGEIYFNLSHSDNRVSFAFSSEFPLGLDIERIRPIPDLLRVANSICTPTELATLKSLPAEQQNKTFLQCWSRKEAFIKALGRGLSYPLDEICASSDGPVQLLNAQPEQTELTDWHFLSWEPGAEYLGAIVSRQPKALISGAQFRSDD